MLKHAMEAMDSVKAASNSTVAIVRGAIGIVTLPFGLEFFRSSIVKRRFLVCHVSQRSTARKLLAQLSEQLGKRLAT